jgi:hypothetical protein
LSRHIICTHERGWSPCTTLTIIIRASPSLVIFFFSKPYYLPIRLTKALQIVGRLVIATHLDQSNYLGNQQQLGLRPCCPFDVPQPSMQKMLGQNHFAELNWHVLTFLDPIFFCRVTYWAPLEILQRLKMEIKVHTI